MWRWVMGLTVVLLLGLYALRTAASEQEYKQGTRDPTTKRAESVAIPRLESTERSQSKSEPESAIAAVENKNLKATQVIRALQTQYSSEEDKNRSVLLSLTGSGPPPPQFAAAGHDFAGALAKESLIQGDWNCYEAGCYFLVAATTPNTFPRSVIKLRDAAASGYVFVVTPESDAHRMIILLNYRDND